MVGYYPYGKNQYNILLSDHSIIKRRNAVFNEIPSAKFETENNKVENETSKYDVEIDEDSVKNNNSAAIKNDYVLRNRKFQGHSANSLVETRLKWRKSSQLNMI